MDTSWIALLSPLGVPELRPLVAGTDLQAWHVDVAFVPWQQAESATALTREETYGFKPQILGSDGSRVAAEIELALRLRSARMNAFWIDTFGSAPAPWARYIAKRDQLPAALAAFLTQIQAAAGKKLGGAPDVVAWRSGSEKDARWIEYKGPKDRIRPGQDAWLRAALAQGLPLESYVVARWDGRPAAREA
jgi:hypothetical protein